MVLNHSLPLAKKHLAVCSDTMYNMTCMKVNPRTHPKVARLSVDEIVASQLWKVIVGFDDAVVSRYK